MAKQEGRPGLEAGINEVKQQDVALLLKKKVQVLDETGQAKAEAPAAEIAAVEPVLIASADAGVAGGLAEAEFAAAEGARGLSTGAWVGIGVAAVGGGLLIAEATDDDDEAAPASGNPAPPAGAKNIELTAGQDDVGNDVTDEDFQISADGTDIVNGITDPGELFSNDETTFSSGDVIKGNGKTIVRLEVDSAGFADVVEMSDVAKVELINGATGTLVFFGGSWDNVGEVSYVGGAGGLGVAVTSADVGLDMSIASNVAGGFIAASYTNNLAAVVFNSGKGGASIIHDANNVADLAVNVANLNSGSMIFAGVAPGDVTVGDMTGVAGNSAFLFAGNTAAVVGDVDVGNIDLTMGDSGFASVSLSATGDLTFGNVDVVIGDNSTLFTTTDIVNAFFTATGDLVGGDISIALGNQLLSTSFTAISFGAFASGNVTLGDISLTVGDVTHTSTGFESVITASVSGSNDITIGDVTLSAGNYTVTGSSSVSGTGYLFFGAYGALAGNGGNVSIGDVSITGGNNYYVSLSASMSSVDQGTAMSVGDVTLSVGDVVPTTLGAAGPGSAGVGLFLNNTSALTGGSLTVGDVSVSMGRSGTGSVSISLTGSGSNAGDLGSLLVGDVTLNLGRDATLTSFTIRMDQDASTINDQGMGSLTVGDINVTAGQDASLSITVSQTLSGTAVAAAMGDFTVGNLTANLDIGAYMYYALYAFNSASYTAGSGTGTLGDVTVGDVTAAVDDGATLSISYTFSGGTGAGANDVGDITIGDLDVTLGVGALLGSYSINITGHDIGAVDIGDISVFVGQSASATSMYIGAFATNGAGADGTIASFSLGNVALTLDVNSTVTSFNVTASASADIGAVSFGDLSILVLEDVNVVTNTASFGSGPNFFVFANDVASVEVGDVSIEAHNMTDTVSVDYSVTASGDIGSFTMGDVSIAASDSSTARLSVSVSLSAAGEIGDINVGNVSLAYTTASTGGVTFTLNQTAATSGDVTIGGITLDYTAVGTTGAAALTDYYTFGVFAGTGDVVIDLVDVNIKISSTNTASAATEITTHLNLTQILASVSGTSISLGTVDYSGVVYSGTLVNPTFTIDVSGFSGDISIIGSSLNDVIIANTTGVISMEGGGGADLFNFGAGNGSILQAGSGKVVDFVHNVDLVTIDGPGVTVNEFGTGTYANFAAFMADADVRFGDAVPEDVVLGQVGTSVFVIVDRNADNNVSAGDVLIEMENASTLTLDFGDFNFV